MNAATLGFSLTIHAIDRLFERHPGIFLDSTLQGKLKRDAASRVLHDAVEDKSVKNNTGFMVWLHEKYGFDRNFRFFVNGDVLFIGIQCPDKQNTIVTTVQKSTSNISHLRNAGIEKTARFKAKAPPSKYRGMQQGHVVDNYYRHSFKPSGALKEIKYATC
jgi:hypothetical protein